MGRPGGLREILRACVPRGIAERYRTARLVRRARELGTLATAVRDPSERLDLVWRFDEFRPFQKRVELLTLLERVSARQPAALCEIGAASGGTLCTLAHACAETAVIVSLDYDFTPARLAAFPHLGRPRQTIVCINGDSHDSRIQQAVAAALGGRMFDVLFIDGDHSYDGVREDFEHYRSLVRSGGLIAFHDIVPDFNTRFGTSTLADVGGVPRFWQELKVQYPRAEQIVEDPAQDGYGIGVLSWTPADGVA